MNIEHIFLWTLIGLNVLSMLCLIQLVYMGVKKIEKTPFALIIESLVIVVLCLEILRIL